MIKFNNLESIKSNLRDYFSKNTQMVVTEPGSVLGGIIESLSLSLYENFKEIKELVDGTKLSSATGKTLDDIATQYGIKRKEDTFTYTSEITAISLSGNVTVNAGTYVYGTNTENEEQVFYVTKTTTVTEFGNTLIIGSVKSGQIGTFPPNSINRIDLPNIKIYNKSAVFSGKGKESDEALRYRITQSMHRLTASTNKGIAANILNVDGISDVIVNDEIKTTVYIKPEFINVPWSVLSEARSMAMESAAAGTTIDVVEPEYLEVNIIISSDYNGTLQQLQSVIKNYIDNLDVGESFVLRDLVTLLSPYYNKTTNFQDIVKEVYYVRQFEGYSNYTNIESVANINKYEKFISGTIGEQ